MPPPHQHHTFSQAEQQLQIYIGYIQALPLRQVLFLNFLFIFVRITTINKSMPTKSGNNNSKHTTQGRKICERVRKYTRTVLTDFLLYTHQFFQLTNNNILSGKFFLPPKHFLLLWIRSHTLTIRPFLHSSQLWCNKNGYGILGRLIRFWKPQ